MNPTSNFALCATTVESPQNSKNLGKIVLMSGASFTISSVIEVSFTISSGIGILGFTNSENSSIISFPFIFTAPISIILSLNGSNPVVSISNTTYVSSSIPKSFGLVII